MGVQTAFGGLADTWAALKQNASALEQRVIGRRRYCASQVRWDGVTLEGLGEYLFGADRDPPAPGAGLILCTTKGGGPAIPVSPFAPVTTMRHVVSNACASGAQGVIEAADLLSDGEYETVNVHGMDVLTDFIAEGFLALNAVSPMPARPFDRRRDGLSLGEAAAGVRLARAAAPGAPRIIAYGCSNDANHVSGPSRDGSGLALAIKRALRGMDRSEIRAICAHGTATVYNDAMEARAFHTAFDGAPPPVFGIKGAIGHTLGAAGLVEVIVSAKAATEGVIPPTAGFEAGEEDYPLDVVHGKPRKIGPGCVLTTNSGFGGMNTAIVIAPGE